MAIVSINPPNLLITLLILLNILLNIFIGLSNIFTASATDFKKLKKPITALPATIIDPIIAAIPPILPRFSPITLNTFVMIFPKPSINSPIPEKLICILPRTFSIVSPTFSKVSPILDTFFSTEPILTVLLNTWDIISIIMPRKFASILAV